MSNKSIALLGMHRSGTSCTTSMLEQAGVYLGNVSRQNKFNPKGNNESQWIMNLHNDLLHINGGDWMSPPENVNWTQVHTQARDAIIASYSQVECWAFKDPRTLFTLDGWLEVLPDLNLIGIFRHPHSVASSLHRRNEKISLDEGYQIWLAYNKKLLYYIDKFKFPVLKFESSEFMKNFSVIIESLELNNTKEKMQWENIYDASLHQKAEQHINLPPEVDAVFSKLNEVTT